MVWDAGRRLGRGSRIGIGQKGRRGFGGGMFEALVRDRAVVERGMWLMVMMSSSLRWCSSLSKASGSWSCECCKGPRLLLRRLPPRQRLPERW